jgi:hypothetical protein
MRRWAAMLALALVQAACGAIPLGNAPGPGFVEDKTVEAFRLRSATRIDVLMAIGDPDRRYLDDRVFGYRWNESVASIAVGIGSFDVKEVRLLLIEFTDDGRVLRTDVVGGVLSSTLKEAVDQWLSKVQDGAR